MPIANLRLLPIALLLSMPLWGQPTGLSTHVNPLIGTDGQGGNHPGATVPWGFVRVGASTRAHGAGYHYADDKVVGFSHIHPSGYDCAQLADVLVVPYSADKPMLKASDYATAMRHADEQAKAGYYALRLKERKINAEFTATTRAALHRYTFEKPQKAALTIDLGQKATPEMTWIKVMGNSEIRGMIRLNRQAPRDLYFVAQTSSPFEVMGIADGSEAVQQQEPRTEGRALAIALRFPSLGTKPLMLKVALSEVDERSAEADLKAELQGWDFERTAQRATELWNKALGRIEVQGGTQAQRTMFYTALYRTLSSARIVGSGEGIFAGPDGYKHRALTPKTDDGTGNQPFTPMSLAPLWSTHRALYPLLSIVAPEQMLSLVNSLVLNARFSGKRMIWERTDSLVRYYAASVIADAHSKNLHGCDVPMALQLLERTARDNKDGVFEMKQYGFIPSDLLHGALPKSIAHAYCDWCVAQLANSQKSYDIYDHFIRRSQAYRNLYNAEQKSVQPRLRNSDWASPQADHPLCSFDAPHDALGLIATHGGNDAFAAHIKSLDSARLYNHAMPQAHHIPYLYTLAGHGYRTQRWVQRLRDSLYSPTPQGLCGNDAGGQLSAWYVLSAIGLYPVCPGSPHYAITTPMFERVTLHFDGGKRFIIRANGLSAERPYIARTVLNAKAFDHPLLSHTELTVGGELQLDMLTRPNPMWAAKSERTTQIIDAEQIAIMPTVQPATRTFADELEVQIVSPQPKASIFYQVLDPADDPQTAGGWVQGRRVVLKKTSILRFYALNGRWSSAIVEMRFDKTE